MADPAYHIFYDGTCVLCQNSKRWLEARDAQSRFTFVDSRDPAAMARFPAITPQETEGQMVVLTPAGQVAGGFDAILLLLLAIPRWRRVAPLLRTRPGRWLGKRVYRWIARNRYRLFGKIPACDAGVCRI